MERNYAVDLLKFVGALFLFLLHYYYPQQLIPQAYLWVEFFFIVAGVFLYKSFDKYQAKPFISIMGSKIERFYPHYCLAIIMFLAYGGGGGGHKLIKMLLFFPHIGLSEFVGWGTLWFLGVYILVAGFLIAIMKNFERSKFLFLAALIFFCASYIEGDSIPNIFFQKTERSLNIPYGVWRGLSAMSFGVLLGFICDFWKNAKIKFPSLFFLFAFAFVVYIMFHRSTVSYSRIIYLFFGIMTFFSLQDNYVSRFMSLVGQKCKAIVALSMPLYIFHHPIIEICRKFGFFSREILWQMAVCLCICLAFSFLADAAIKKVMQRIKA